MSDLDPNNKAAIKAMELSKKLIDLKWQLKRVEFAKYCKEEERKNVRVTTTNILTEVNKFSENYDVDVFYGITESRLKLLETERKELEDDLKDLSTICTTKKDLLREQHDEVIILKKRNAALKLKLLKQNVEYNNKLQVASDQLQCLKKQE